MRNKTAGVALNTPFNQQIAALTVTGLLAFLFPAGLLALFLWPAYREAMTGAGLRAIEEKKTWNLLLTFGPVIAIGIAHPSPPDDLLRNLQVWRHDYDYRAMYWGSPGVQRGDYYLGFDWFVGQIDAVFLSFGLEQWSWLPVVLLDALGWGVALVAVFRRLLKSDEDLPWMIGAAAILLLWLSPNFTARVLAGRPESFFALWAFCALAVESWGAVVAWVTAGLFLSTTYWFFWIYLPAGILLWHHKGWDRSAWLLRVGVSVFLAVFGMTFWFWVSGGRYVDWFWHLHEAMSNRVANVGENERLILGLMTPSVLVLLAIGVAVRGGSVPRESRYVILALTGVAAWFALPNMVRYLDSILPLVAALVVILAGQSKRLAVLPREAASAAALLLLGLFVWTALDLGTASRPMKPLHLEGAHPGQRVLTWFSQDTYDASYLNPGLRVAPSFEVGFSPKDVQKASENLKKGRIDCAWLDRHQVSWVIAPPAPLHARQWGQCLDLIRSTADGTTIWRLRKTAPGR